MFDTPIEEVMTKDVVAITPDLKIDVALEEMRSRDIRRLVVQSDRTGRLSGIITRDDAAGAMPAGTNFYEDGVLAEIPPVRDVMTRDVVTIAPTATVAEAAQKMVDHKVGALPVLREHEIVGIITESDLFRYIASQYGEVVPDTGDLP